MTLSVPGLAGQPLILGHRGAAGHLPEHTRSGYILAIAAGADYIEPDLVSTRDGELIVRHENDISETTDVAQKYPARKTRKVVDGKTIDGWFTEDFTLGELNQIKARERIPALRPGNTSYNDQFNVPTLDQIIELAEKHYHPTVY